MIPRLEQWALTCRVFFYYNKEELCNFLNRRGVSIGKQGTESHHTMYELTPTCFLIWTVLLSVFLKWCQAEVYTSVHNSEVKNTSLATAFNCSKGNNRNKETLELEAEPGPSSQEINSIQSQAWTLEGSPGFWTYRWPYNNIIIIL